MKHRPEGHLVNFNLRIIFFFRGFCSQGCNFNEWRHTCGRWRHWSVKPSGSGWSAKLLPFGYTGFTGLLQQIWVLETDLAKTRNYFLKVALHDIEWPPPNYSSFLLLSFPHKIFDKCFFAAKIMQLALSTSVLIWLSYPIRATIYWKVYKVDKNNTAHISRGNIFFISEFSCSLIDQNVLTFDSLLCRESKLTCISIKTGANNS